MQNSLDLYSVGTATEEEVLVRQQMDPPSNHCHPVVTVCIASHVLGNAVPFGYSVPALALHEEQIGVLRLALIRAVVPRRPARVQRRRCYLLRLLAAVPVGS